ncbi:alanine--tRNA ligase [Alicyclobacillus cellulosilyticus]|uniref:Alanine--tRNA ligase n=1 Tax=Alicyclobacillus cellulosilyticus TaxID=1003997 RepID=A0A917KH13_9BACL|nr:alanine--tRNA ligase [Alicyclobacillus cellulosilyticus]GGJ11984.1 alanine--tRNA ligase [Alicyclobacillus cellulosilyticus]
MKRLSGQEIRRAFKQFFADRGHLVFPSASLVPVNDPTLLWINAGMAPLKPYFDGREVPEKPRIVSAQKCIRTNDIEHVGYTARHQTFFEMLGNFSFGDYFKREAIHWAYEFLTTVLELDPDRISVTVHVHDDEAYQIWHQEVGIPAARIHRGEEDNFWEIGEGPCGPCSEIYYDRGPQYGCGRPTCGPGCDCDRFLEIWNLVFTQYNKEPDGSYTPLPKKNIDTGSGLERLASILQDVPNNFETDLFRPIIDATSRLAQTAYGVDAARDVYFKIIADHVRTVVFAIGDGVLPGNEGRSYIIRRLLRRAVRSGRRLGMERPFLYELAPVVADIMGDDYPEVREKLAFIQRVVRTEEERFLETLSEGEALLLQLITDLRRSGRDVLAGTDAFRLYDTFGFPIDLTEEIAREHGVNVDRAGFEAELAAQRERARQARQVAEGMSSERGVLETITTPSRFVGYDTLTAAAEVTAILVDGELVDVLDAGQEGQVLLDQTPFYAESGGQIADRGRLASAAADAEVLDVRKAPHGQHLHTIRVVRGRIATGDKLQAQVDEAFRRDIVKNHTATHLLHKALRDVLGTHVAQAGSLVEPERLRFDFSHFGALTPEELRQVEDRVNEAVWRDHPVIIREMDLDEAKAMGAMALFGEKYGRRVRVVQAGESIELCGGCHVERTGIIGLFRIVAETGIGSGVRRIEAVTGRHAYRYVQAQEGLLRQAADLLKAAPADVPARVERLLQEVRGLERELESARARLSHSRAAELRDQAVTVEGIPVVAAVVPDADIEAMRQMVDVLRGLLPSHVVVLGSAAGGRPQFVAAVSKDLQARGFHAGQIVKQVAAVTGGSGGGRPDMAQAGGKDAAKLAQAVASVPGLVRALAGNAVR